MPLLAGSIDGTSGLDDRLLAAHNRERSALGIPPLAWDHRLAADARQWAFRLARSGRLEHQGGGASGQGENLWAGTSGAFAPERMVQSWAEEKRHFRPGIFPNVSRSNDWSAVGRYTQMIWRRTSRVGCAVASGEGEDVLVCRYAAPGNVIGERPV